ncbi:hypothetical protein ACU4GD_04960 [Cupriavidus basilensis]
MRDLACAGELSVLWEGPLLRLTIYGALPEEMRKEKMLTMSRLSARVYAVSGAGDAGWVDSAAGSVYCFVAGEWDD